MIDLDNKRILLVEDEAIVAVYEKKILTENGFQVFTAKSGEKAIEIALANPDIDLILMDIDLGDGMDGIDSAEIILRAKEVPVVFLSSHTEPEIVEKTEKITSYGYIVKNSGDTVLLASIKMAFKLFDANLKLSEAAEYWQNTFDSISDIVTVISRDHDILAVNEAGCKSLNMKKEDIIGQKCYEIVHNTTEPIPGCPCNQISTEKKEIVTIHTERGKELRLSAWPITNSRGDLTSFVHIVKVIKEIA
jgi:PAS domain S-box-containing protein